MAHLQCPVIILAGGKSTRLGRDKASELLDGKTLLQRTADASAALASRYLLVTARNQPLPAVAAAAPVTTLEDAFPATGPLGGIATALEALSPEVETLALVLACDTPLLQPALLQELLRLAPGHDAVAPVHRDLPQPLCAVYAQACLEPARRLLAGGDYRTTNLLAAVDALLLPESHWRSLDPQARSFLNINREADLQQALTLLRRP